MAERERTGDVKPDGGAENAPHVPCAGQPWRHRFRARFEQELEAINSRRRAEEKRRTDEEAKAREQRPDHKSAEAQFSDVAWRGDEKTISAVGLALSGGGIRSSAICLGVLQALNHRDLIKRIDYLSTVSGGGYIGSSLTASISQTGKFAFGAALPADAAHASEIRDTRAVGHIRNYSNYLIPAGTRDVLTGIAIVVRGLIANLSLTVPRRPDDLTDGGHIENLGVYELLRRRCKVIIAVDAEADEPMNFSALMTLQRYARTDLGIIIDLPWEPIRARTRELMSRNSAKAAAPEPSAAPASPIGTIRTLRSAASTTEQARRAISSASSRR